MTKITLEAPSHSAGVAPLLLVWDPATGEISGPSADLVRALAQDGAVNGHPAPRAIELGPEPLRSWRDMAAIVGCYWVLPDELARHYPKLRGRQDPYVRDGEGNVIGEVTY